jgi:hypothetical protein
MSGPFYGKYRGQVANNMDPMLLGRLQVRVPAVLGSGQLSWAMPCVPYAGPHVGFFALPPVDANVWVEFEGGDPDYPIWSGCFWGTGEVPVAPAIADIKVFKTQSITLTLSDLPGGGGCTLEVGSPAVPVPLKLALQAQGISVEGPQGATVQLRPSGIEISYGAASITLALTSVSINNGALEVT